MHDVDTWMFFKWIFKTFCAVLIVTNTWNIVMGIFDVGQSVVNSSAGVIIGDTSIDVNSVITDLEAQVEALSTGELFGLWFQSLFVGITMNALSICIIKDKFCLTIDEAAEYFNIGEKKLRKIVADYIDSGFVIQNGVKVLIKRKRFEDFLEDITAL